MSKTRFGYAIFAALGIAFIAAALYFGDKTQPRSLGLDAEKASSAPSTLGVPGASPIAPLVAERTPPPGYRLYRNTHYRFSFFYPENLTLTEKYEGEGASTIVVQNPKEGLGFQVFVVPYGFSYISDKRFQKDEPSGVRLNPTAVNISGVEGVSFFSKNTALGDTAEIWFIKDGYLYEVTTPKILSDWLSGIMQTWKFI